MYMCTEQMKRGDEISKAADLSPWYATAIDWTGAMQDLGYGRPRTLVLLGY
jgi:hypothetical protein